MADVGLVMINATLGILVWVYPPIWGGNPTPRRQPPLPRAEGGGGGAVSIQGGLEGC
jgi:hypothetical protein